MSVITAKRYYNLEEYLELEEQAEYKNEYRDGEIVPMTGGTANHSDIVGNFYFYFRLTLGKQNYRIFKGDLKLWIPRYQQATYPDVMIIAGKPIYEGEKQTIVTNPCLIVEVLSNSTKNYDQGDKFMYYRSIPELKEYILIEQDRHYVMQYSQTFEEKWVLTKYEGKDAILSLTSVNLAISFENLYEGIDLVES